MRTFFTKHFFLLTILLLGVFLRTWKLSNVPPSTSMDEASIGYNAYSVIKTGRDEYGQFPLVSQRGYDDWRRSTYLFLTTPFVAVFGLQSFAIRLPAVILSILTLLATYKITTLLFIGKSNARSAGLLATLLLAISPWHVYISRLGHESNAYLSFFVFGVLCFLIGLEKGKVLILSGVFFLLSMISYYAGQVTVPLFVLCLFSLHGKRIIQLIKRDRLLLLYTGIFLLVCIPIVLNIFSPAALTRYRGTSAFSPDVHPVEYANRVLQRNKAVKNHDILGQIIYNRRLFPVQIFLQEYISHFDPRWLFFNSYKEPFKVPRMGLLYIWELPLILLGILFLAKDKKIDIRAKAIVYAWFFIAPFPGSIATQAPHAMRAYAFLPTWQIFSSLGLVFLLNFLKTYRSLLFIGLFIVVGLSVKMLYVNYYHIFPLEQSNSFHYALSYAIPYVMSHESQFANVIFSNTDNLYQSYMLYLYYTKFDPKTYQALGGTVSGGYAQTHTIGKFAFRPLIGETPQSNILYLANPSEMTEGKIVARFYNKDGSVAIVAKTL